MRSLENTKLSSGVFMAVSNRLFTCHNHSMASNAENEVVTDKGHDELEKEKEAALEQAMESVYTLQHFDFTADNLVDAIFNEAVKHFTGLIPGLKKALLSAASVNKTSEEIAVISLRLDSQVAKFTESFYADLEKYSDALLLYLEKHIITIPKNKILPVDKNQLLFNEMVKILQESDDEFREEHSRDTTTNILLQRLRQHRQKFFEQQIEKIRLKQKILAADRTLKRLDDLKEKIKLVKSTFGTNDSLRETVLSEISNLKALGEIDEAVTEQS